MTAPAVDVLGHSPRGRSAAENGSGDGDAPDDPPPAILGAAILDDWVPVRTEAPQYTTEPPQTSTLAPVKNSRTILADLTGTYHPAQPLRAQQAALR